MTCRELDALPPIFRNSCHRNSSPKFRCTVTEISEPPRAEAKHQLFVTIDGFYNSSRLRSALGYIGPAELEHSAAEPRTFSRGKIGRRASGYELRDTMWLGMVGLNIDHLWVAATLILAPFVGSFVGLLTLRLPAGRAWAMSRSRCDGCKRKLGFIDLVPMFSFLALRGRCRTCGAPIPLRYILLESGCFLIALWSAFAFSGAMVLVTALFGWALLLIATIDAEHLWLPDMLTLPFGALGAIVILGMGQAPVWEPFVGVAVGFGALALIAWLYRRVRGFEGMGGGDPRLLGAIGAWVGWQGLPSVLIWSCVAGLSVATAQAIVRRRFAANQQLPFGTFLAVGAWLTWLWGPLHSLWR